VAEEPRLFDPDIAAQLPLHRDRGSAAAEDVLRRVAQTATEVGQASARLSRAVVKARQAGCSWRRIGDASGIPYQSLHRKFAGPRGSGRRNGYRSRGRFGQTPLVLNASATFLSVVEAEPLTEPVGEPSLVHLVRRDGQHGGFGLVHVRWVVTPLATVELDEHDQARPCGSFVPVW
jgi:hypothetical protein